MTILKRRLLENWEVLVMAGILLLAASLRWERLGSRNLWQDEAFSLDAARRSIPAMLAFVRANDAHPVGYYMLLSVWIRTVGENLAWMRALSAIFGVVAILLTWRMGRRLFSPGVGVGAAALLALNPFQIFASNELRMYMPLEVLAIASTWALWWASSSPRGYSRWIVYGVSLALMGYISYYSFLLIPAHVLWLFLHHPPRRAARQAGVAILTALILYAPWTPYVAGSTGLVRGGLLNVRGQGLWSTYVPELLASQTFGGYLFNMLSYHNIKGLDLQYYGVILFPFLVLIAAGASVLGGINGRARNLAGLCWLVPVTLVVAASLALGKVMAYAYHLNFLQPFLALFVAAGVIHFREAVDRSPSALLTLTTIAGVLVFFAPAVDNLQSNPDYQAYRFDNAAGFVKKLYQPGDVVIYLPQGVRRGFSFYFVPPGRELGVEIDASHRTKEAVQASIQKVADSLTPADKRVWLVYMLPVPEGTVRGLVESIEQRGYRRVDFQDFKGIFLGLLVRPIR